MRIIRPQIRIGRGALIALGAAVLMLAATTRSGPLSAAPVGGAWTLPQAAGSVSDVETVAAARSRSVGRSATFARSTTVRSTTVRSSVLRSGTVARSGVVNAGRLGVVGVSRGAIRSGYAFRYRPWVRRAWWGTAIGGVVLGTIIYTSYVPAAPAEGLCWFWANPEQTQGYWDYCQAPY